jgi:glucosyl-dolichyl phosphate glucuronosyltransferase
MNVTVILCTYNRCRELANALNSVAASTLPDGVEWEVLVVDNNNVDQTREVVESFRARYAGRFRYLFEPRPGKSHALNAGIRASQSDVLAFLDDDVTVEPTWLKNLIAGLHGEEWAGAGGRIVLKWPSSLPGWLSVEGPFARHVFPGFDQGLEAKELAESPIGTNMAFRKEIFEKYGGFRTDLGPSPGTQINSLWGLGPAVKTILHDFVLKLGPASHLPAPRPNEDTEFGRRLITAGERLRYEPSAVVYHAVPQNRIQKKYFLAWWFDKGRADTLEFEIRPVRMFLSLTAWTLRWMVAVEPRVRFFRKMVVWEKAGEAVEYCHQMLDGRSPAGGPSYNRSESDLPAGRSTSSKEFQKPETGAGSRSMPRRSHV